MSVKDKVRVKPTAEPADVETKPKKAADVTYIPGDGDPHRVTWGGLEFKAHIPTLVPLTHAISVPMRTLAERAGVFLTA